MSIVLNEFEWAERAIENHDLGKHSVETLTRVCKYYIACGYSKREAREMLEHFLVQCSPNVVLNRWSDLLDKIVKNVNKYTIVKIDGVNITKRELEQIEKIEGKQIKRLAFTLLCLAKYWNVISPANNSWVNTSDKEIMQMANINTSIKRQSAHFGTLKEAGLIRFSKKIDNLNVQVLFADDDKNGEVALTITDYRNLGYQYLRYYGGSFFECANCGIVEKANENARGPKQKYCATCAIEVKTRQSVNAVMRNRRAQSEVTV